MKNNLFNFIIVVYKYILYEFDLLKFEELK